MGKDDAKLSDVRQITWGFQNHEHPVFSPDGRQLAYYAGTFGYIQLFVSGVDGRAARPLTADKGNHTQACWSPDGSQLYYRVQREGGAPWEIWRVNVEDPAQRERLLHDRRASFKHPSVSPDGRWLAWFSDHGSPGNFHLFKAKLAGGKLGKPIRLTSEPDRNDCHPTWSPDGSQLTFHAYMGAEDASESHIYVCDADGSGLRRLSTEEGFHKHPFFVGRDLIVHHVEGEDGRRSLVLRSVSSGEVVTRLTSGKNNDKHPSAWVSGRAPVRICFASKKRGDASFAEGGHTYDVFWGHLTGTRVRR